MGLEALLDSKGDVLRTRGAFRQYSQTQEKNGSKLPGLQVNKQFCYNQNLVFKSIAIFDNHPIHWGMLLVSPLSFCEIYLQWPDSRQVCVNHGKILYHTP